LRSPTNEKFNTQIKIVWVIWFVRNNNCLWEEIWK